MRLYLLVWSVTVLPICLAGIGITIGRYKGRRDNYDGY